MKKTCLLWISLLIPMFALSQHGGSGAKVSRLVPGENVQEFLSGKRVLPDSISFKGSYYVVVTLRSIPTQEERETLRQKGIVLHSYLGSNTYYATIRHRPTKGAVAEQLAQTPIVAVTEGLAEWKISEEIRSGAIPAHAVAASGIVRVNLLYFEDSALQEIRSYLGGKGYRVNHVAGEFQTITLEIPTRSIQELARQPWVRWIEYVAPPAEPENVRGRSMSRANILGQTALGGRGLTGKGVSVGIWDGSIEAHPDLGNRLVTKEFEYISDHGQHTAGTLTGAGLIDPKARGMAPEATLYAWNFNTQSNGLNAQQEMLISARDYGVVITSNSYGVAMNNATSCVTPPSYNSGDLQLDQLQNLYPQLLHVFSAGNDQGKCTTSGNRYFTSTKRAKNSIHVGALDQLTGMTDFSSWGPMNDGRILPHITAFGDWVYSTVYNNGYEGDYWSGTSMACPNVSGTATLLYQRYKQIYGDYPIASLVKGALLNTAEDKGNPGPDYQFGYGSMDGLRAVEVLEKNHFFVGSIDNGEELTHTINVPAGAKALRVMLVWTDAQGATAQKALINDLDLTLEKGGTTHLPWILNPQNPSGNATTGVDRLNNQEQVTLINPAQGAYTIRVKGFEVPQGPQQYSVVYDYYAPTLMLTYPNGGERFNPGDSPVIRWASIGYTGTYTLQYSTDNGATFQNIATGIPNSQKDYIFTVPSTVTSQGVIRVIQDGTMDTGDAPFSIMNVAKNLKLTPAACGETGWKLRWTAATGAAKYEVLKANVDAGTYAKIGETTGTSYDLPALEGERNIYSVVVVAADGTVSERAYAVIANPSLGVDLQALGLPVEEELVEFPSSYIQVSAGIGVSTSYTPTLFANSGAHLIKMQGNETTTTTWSAAGDLFAENPDDVASAKICNIDARNITGPLWLRTAAVMGNSGTDNARFRLLADGAAVTNTYGNAETSAIGSGQNIMYWDLSSKAGSQFSLEFQAVLRNKKDSVMFGHFLLWQPKNDAGITKLTLPEAATTLGTSESITIDVRNYSGNQLTNIPVSYRINGGSPVEEVIAGPVAPFKTLTYTFATKANLSEADVLFSVEATVSYPGDETESNNTKAAQTARLGDYYLMPTTTTGNTLKATATTKLFTDNGGRVLPYGNGVTGTVVISPTTAGKKVKVRFLEFDVEEGYDKLTVRNGNLSTSPVVDVLTGNSYTLPFELISTATAGELRFVFSSDSEGSRAGWVAEVSEVEPGAGSTLNTFAVTGLPHYNGNYNTPTTIRVKVKNQGATTANGVNVRYRVDGEPWVSGVIPAIAAGEELTYSFSQQLTIPQPGRTFTLTAEVASPDSYMDDNVRSTTIISDRYCIPFTNYSSTNSFYIAGVGKGDVVKATGGPSKAYPQYYRDQAFSLYKDLTGEAIGVTVNSHQTNGKIGIFIDWNTDGDFADAGEAFTTGTTSGVTTYSIPVAIPESAATGQYPMRARIFAATSAMSPCESIYSNGETEDYTVEVFEAYPTTKDVAVTATTLASGANLGATETVTATIRNNASAAVGNFDIAYRVNSGAEVRETVTATIEPFTTHDYTFTGKANLAAAGAYTVEIYTLLTDDQQPDNDKLTTTVTNEVPAADGFFALRFDGANDVVNAGTLGGVNLQSFTYEAWVNPASYGGYGGPIGFGRLFEGKGATIFLHGETNTNYPEHCLVVSGVGGGTYHTQAGSINLNVWQHVAVTFDSNSKALTVYLNGNEIPVTAKTPAGTVQNNSAGTLYIGNSAAQNRPFKGMMDEARVWSVTRTQADIQAGMYAHQTGETGLMAEFRFDEGYFNSSTVSGGLRASIENADITASESSIWVVPTVDFSSYALPSQVIGWERVAENHYRTEVAQGTNLTSLVATFALNYPNATVTVATTNQVSGTTPNSFANSETAPVQYDLAATIFGKNLATAVKFSVKEELSAEATMSAFAIPQLLLAASPVTMNMVFDVDESVTVAAVVPTFTISAGAKAYVNGAEVTSGVTAVDFSSPVVFAVVAANGRATGYYNVSIRKQQTITWTPASLTKTYGDGVFTLEATSSAGAQITYTSSNPDAISVALNRATVKGVGSATITAYQYGGNSLTAAAPVAKTFTVSPKVLTITADSKTIDYSDAIPELTMSFAGFVDGENESVIDNLPQISTTAVQNSPAGTYPITLTGGSDDSYSLNLVNGILTISSVAAFDVTFHVTFDGAAEQGATVTINGVTLTTSAAGTATVTLKAGTYPYTVTKAGREGHTGTVTLAGSNVTENVALINALPIHTVTYLTDGNGTISGEATQNVKHGQDGTEVTATPNFGYNFSQWDDGLTAATRKATNVQGPITVTAQFTLKTYTLTYNAGENGTISGVAVQTVQHGSNGTAVTVTPEPGCTFVRWSDGVTDNPRTDLNVMMDKTVTAEYVKIYTLPYAQTFDATTLPVDWMNIDNAGSGGIWTFKSQGKYSTDKLSGSNPNMAFLDSDTYGSGKSQNADLVSPLFDLSAYSTVTLKFKHYYKHVSSSAASISYSIDGAAWVEVQKWTATTENPAAFEQEVAAVAGQSNVRFKWSYTGSWGYFWIVDDVELTGAATAGSYTVTYRAGENGSLTGATDGVVTQTVAHGANGPTVTAVANHGFAFYRWSDGITANPRTDVVVKPIDVTAVFGSDCSPIATVPYKEPFESTQIPDCWSAPSNANNHSWAIGSSATVSSGKHILFDGSVLSYGGSETAELISPTFDLSGQSGDVYLSFWQYFSDFSGGNAKVMYSADNGATWTELGAWAETTDEVFSKKLPEKSAQTKFKWIVNAKWFTRWYIDDVELRTEQLVSLSYDVNGEYEEYTWKPYGSIDGESYQVIVAGTSGTPVTALAKEGYHFVRWSDGVTANPRTDANVTENTYVKAEFAPNATTYYTLTYTADAGKGTISGAATQSVLYGASGTAVTAVASTGYRFVRWSDGVTANPRTDENVTSNITVEAEFAEDVATYTLTYTAGAGGTISGAATQTVNHGESGTAVTAVASAGYRFVRWSDGVTANPRTDENVTSNITVEAEFAMDTGIDGNSLSNVVAYPNPCGSNLYINNSESVVLVVITDLSGREVLRQTNNGLSKISIETTSLKPGMYLVSIITNTNSKTIRKVVKE